MLVDPGKLAGICEGRSRTEIEEALRGEVYEALEELSRPILPVDTPWQAEGDAAPDDDEEKEII